jgi:hypothetical protein
MLATREYRGRITFSGAWRQNKNSEKQTHQKKTNKHDGDAKVTIARHEPFLSAT